MKMWKVLPVFTLAGALWLQPAPASAHGMSPCRDDVKRLCGEDKYSRAGIAACLEQHNSDLSPACQEHVAAKMARREKFRQACGADADKLCPNADPGRKTIWCLSDHDSDLSPTCKDEIATIREHHYGKCHGDKQPAADGTQS